MPMYDYRCTRCGYEFEELVLGSREPRQCPRCAEEALERKVSAFATTSGAGRTGATAPAAGRCTSFG